MNWIRPEFDAPIAAIQARIEADLASLERAGPPGSLWSTAMGAVREIATGPRRMVRPQLALLGHLGAGGDLSSPGLSVFCAGIELMHLFALVHDDVMDHGTVRRGVPTVQRAIRSQLPFSEVSRSEHLAVLIGDLLHSRSISLLLEGGSHHPGGHAAMEVILQGSCRAGFGQFLDLQGWDGPAEDLSSAEFRGVLLDKGGHHSITAPLAAGWRLCAPVPDALVTWGDHVGLAFQGLDDIQDILESPATLGKDSLQDLREGRLSLVGRILREQLNDDEWDELIPSLGRGVMPAEVRIRLFHLFRRHRLVERGLAVVRQELDDARRIVGALPAGSLSEGLQEIGHRLVGFADRLEEMPRL
ncbi:MAG: geranylgeranyl pyrophosphate synthase [Myxococcota bacterium]|jgi:geranylgeranyl pyrophosphate synthase